MPKAIKTSELKKEAKKISRQIGISESAAYDGLVKAAHKKGYIIVHDNVTEKQKKQLIKNVKARITKKTPRLR